LAGRSSHLPGCLEAIADLVDTRLCVAGNPVERTSARSRASPTLLRLAWRSSSATLQQRGLLEDTLVVWGGEFGRTVYCQGKLTAEDYGRDHHPRCFTIWLAGGGIKPGMTHGETDDYSYNIERDPVHVHDLHATILHCLKTRPCTRRTRAGGSRPAPCPWPRPTAVPCYPLTRMQGGSRPARTPR
jgi:hypothetical protein